MIQGTFERLYDNPIAEKYVNWATKATGEVIKQDGKDIAVKNYDKLQEYVPIALMTWIPIIQSAYFARSKEMPQDKKVTLISNEAYTAVLGVAVSLLFRKQIKGLTNKFVEQAKKVYIAKKDTAEYASLENGIKTAVPATFAVMFCQYIAPVLTMPFATKTTQYLIKKGKIKDPNEQKPLDKKA